MKKLKIDSVTLTLGNHTILKDVTLECEPGKVYGFIGGNGSGKTMLFRVMGGLLKPNQGKVLWNDSVLYDEISSLPSLGIMIENVGLYPDLSLKENLISLTRIRKEVGIDRIDEVIKQVGLQDSVNKQFKKYSLGMKKRAVLAQAIIEYPAILILDEPSAALDEDGKKIFRDIIMKEKERGTCIIISSHDKDDIEQLCDDIYRVDAGTVTRITEV